MNNLNLGYACINMSLRKLNVYCSRTARKKTFIEKGLSHMSSLALQNVKDLYVILKWNAENNVTLFRITSEMFPWASEYELESLPDFEEISKILLLCGNFARDNNIRLSFHPGQFNCLSSEKDHVIENSVKDLNHHSEIFDLMGYEANHSTKINIHLGSTCNGNLSLAADNFCRNFHLLHANTQQRLTVENDDKPAMFSAKFLYENIYKRIGTPIVFDAHHFELGPQDSDYNEAFFMSYETWINTIPTFHYSNSKKTYEDQNCRVFTAHSDYYYKPFESYGKRIDLMLEAKHKELALFKYKEDFL
jgi:UV DNA damage endonuclease